VTWARTCTLDTGSTVPTALMVTGTGF